MLITPHWLWRNVASHIQAIIDIGILRQLRKLMASDSSVVLEQVLDTLKYLGLAYRQAMIDENLAPSILKLVTSSDASVKLKAMDIFDKFKRTENFFQS